MWSMAVVALLIVANKTLFSGQLGSSVGNGLRKPLGYIQERFGWTRSVSDTVYGWRSSTKVIQQLEDEKTKLQSQIGKLEEVQAENAFLRKSLGLRSVTQAPLLEGTLSFISAGPDSHQAILNKGSDQGIEVDSPVVTEGSVLVGRIMAVNPNSSVVQTVRDPSFEVIAKVLDGSTSGLARGKLSEGMSLDLVTKEDAIKEGDTVLSGGDNQIPPGLVIGTVDFVEVRSTTLFRAVRIQPIFDDTRDFRVIVIGRTR